MSIAFLPGHPVASLHDSVQALATLLIAVLTVLLPLSLLTLIGG